MSLSPFDSFQSRFVTYLLNFPRRMRNISDKICRENQTHISCLIYIYIFFFENSAVCEIMSKNIVYCGSPQMTIWRMSFACWIHMATDTHSDTYRNLTLPRQIRPQPRQDPRPKSPFHICNPRNN